MTVISSSTGATPLVVVDSSGQVGLGTTPALSTAANKVDYIDAVYDSTNAKGDVIAVSKGY